MILPLGRPPAPRTCKSRIHQTCHHSQRKKSFSSTTYWPVRCSTSHASTQVTNPDVTTSDISCHNEISLRPRQRLKKCAAAEIFPCWKIVFLTCSHSVHKLSSLLLFFHVPFCSGHKLNLCIMSTAAEAIFSLSLLKKNILWFTTVFFSKLSSEVKSFRLQAAVSAWLLEFSENFRLRIIVGGFESFNLVTWIFFV